MDELTKPDLSKMLEDGCYWARDTIDGEWFIVELVMGDWYFAGNEESQPTPYILGPRLVPPPT